METRRARAERNAYFTMFDSSIECLEDNQTDPKQVMREKIEKLEAEGDRVRGELGVCQKQLKDKCREISVLKRKMTVLEKQTKDIEAYKRLNRKITGGADDGRIKLDDLLKEIESLRRERETTMEQYVRNNEVIMKKLQESESANRILRSNFDDAVERLEGYQCYINKIDIDNCRSIPHMRRTNVAASETNSTGQPTGQPKIIVMGDETARGLGWRLRSRLNDRVECLTKPGCTLENMVGNIHQSVTKASPGDTIIVLTGFAEEIKVTALKNGVAELPCDITSNNDASSSVILVVWYKDEVPVYSWDARVTSARGQHWTGAVLDSRAKWAPRPARLSLKPVEVRDGGVYKCRADFRAEPSRFTHVRLMIVEPPSDPKIYGEDDKEIVGKAGPFKEGDTPMFFCVVTGGNPPPTVRWFRGSEILPSTGWAGPEEYDSVIARHRSKGGLKHMGLPVRLPALKREDLLSNVSCKANNSHLLSTLSSDIILDMILPPIFVEILPRDPLRAGINEVVECKVVGARPPAKIHWLLNGVPLPPNTYNQEESPTGDVSISKIKFVPGREHRGQQLVCRATHILQPPLEPLTSSLTMEIWLPPDVSLRLGRNVNLENISAGDSVPLECNVVAHPPPYKIVWEHNGRTIAHEPTSGVELDWGRLTLPKIEPSDSGAYSCTASNVEGDTKSNTINIQVLHLPVCRMSEESSRPTVLSSRKEVELICQVSAHPPPTNFTWALNTSAGLVHLPKDKISWSDTTSKLRFSSASQLESSAEALCWANNKVGRQQVPCALSLNSPAPPAPKNCALQNLTSSEFILLCEKGNDALTKSYELTVQLSSDQDLLANLTTSQPVFRVSGLPGSKELRLLLYAVGTFKRSNPVELFIIMPQPPKNFKGGNASLHTVLLFVFSIAAIIIFSSLIAFMKYRNKIFERFQGDFKPSRQAATGVREAECSSIVHEERNPDVVPLKKDQNGTVQMRAEEEWEVSARSPRLQSETSSLTRDVSIPEAIGTWSIRTQHGREVVTSCTPLPLTQESCV